MKFIFLYTVVFFLTAMAPLGAVENADKWSQYNHLKDDSDLYVGEGIAKISDFGGDAEKCRESASVRAKAEMIESIHVDVSSVTTESMRSDGKSSKEELASNSRASSALGVDNLKIRVFKDFPAEGKITVLAYLSKQDYRRQLAGKAVAIYTPENGLRLKCGFTGSDAWYGGQGPHVGLDLYWRSFVVGAQVFSRGVEGVVTPTQNGMMDVQTYQFWEFSAGYDWTPWRWKFQPFIPLRVDYQLFENDPLVGNLFGASAGLGMRYWPMDAIAFDFGWRYELGLNRLAITDKSGAPILDRAGKAETATLNGSELFVGIVWSGF